MNRDYIIDKMCFTWRHDYGLEKPDSPVGFAIVKLLYGMIGAPTKKQEKNTEAILQIVKVVFQ